MAGVSDILDQQPEDCETPCSSELWKIIVYLPTQLIFMQVLFLLTESLWYGSALWFNCVSVFPVCSGRICASFFVLFVTCCRNPFASLSSSLERCSQRASHLWKSLWRNSLPKRRPYPLHSCLPTPHCHTPACPPQTPLRCPQVQLTLIQRLSRTHLCLLIFLLLSRNVPDSVPTDSVASLGSSLNNFVNKCFKLAFSACLT